MEDEESTATSSNVPEPQKKRGRKPSGLPLAQVRKNATANRLQVMFLAPLVDRLQTIVGHVAGRDQTLNLIVM